MDFHSILQVFHKYMFLFQQFLQIMSAVEEKYVCTENCDDK